MEITQQHAPLEALASIRRLLSAITPEQLDACTDQDLVDVMRAARKLRGQTDALACVATQKVDIRKAAVKVTGTPTASLIGLDDHVDSKRAVGQVARAAEVTKHQAAQQAALDGTISPEQAQAISKGIDSLPELPEEVRTKLAENYVTRARGTTANKLARLAPQILEEVAPEHALSRETQADRAARQRARAVLDRRFAWGNTGEGSVWFKGQLPELEAEPLVRTLTAMVEAGKRAERDQEQQLRDAGVDPAVRYATMQPLKRRSQLQRNADALITLIDGVTTTGTSTLVEQRPDDEGVRRVSKPPHVPSQPTNRSPVPRR